MIGSSSHVPPYLLEYMGVLEESIDQTLLKYDASERDYIDFIEKSEKYRFRAIVVPQVVLPVVTPITKHVVGTVVGFPNGYTPLKVKLSEIDLAVGAGAREIDAVLNTILVKSGKWSDVRHEVSSIVDRAREYGVVVKAIIETSILKKEEIRTVSRIVEESGAHFIKTNTGFGTRGVAPSDILVIKSSITGKSKIKASGGIRSAIDAALMLYLGAHVIGTSSGVEIVEEAKAIASGVHE